MRNISCFVFINSLPPLSMFTSLPITGRLLAGRWTSRSCEVRPGSLFLTRQLRLQADNGWGAEFHYFTDPDCSRPEFSVSVSGRYIRAGRSGRVPGAANIDFLLTSAAVRPQSQQILSGLNSSTCGLAELWQLDHYQANITASPRLASPLTSHCAGRDDPGRMFRARPHRPQPQPGDHQGGAE